MYAREIKLLCLPGIHIELLEFHIFFFDKTARTAFYRIINDHACSSNQLLTTHFEEKARIKGLETPTGKFNVHKEPSEPGKGGEA